MQFSNDEDEGDFGLNNATRSRLSSLFHSDTTSGDVNQVLTFTAPKQPKKPDPKADTQSNPETLKLIHAAVVHAYKLKDGSYAHQGKVGCAILGQHQESTYKCLLYKGNQVQITTCSILPTTVFHVQPNNYVNFYNEKKENWSLNFESEPAFVNFCKQIAIAKANSQGKSLNSLVIQDIILGDGPSLENLDSAEVKYTGWLFSNNSFGPEFDSNVKSDANYRVRLGKSKIIKGWSEGLIGAQKGGKRILVIPPQLAYGSTGMGSAIPPNSTLIFEIHIVKVKFSKESSHSPSPMKESENTVEKMPEVVHRASISQDDNIRLRGASISEQLTQSPRKDKAHLISRMAKMGTATLPFQGAIVAQVDSDSEKEEETIQKTPPPVQTTNSRTASPKLSSKPHSRKNSGSSTVDQPTYIPNIPDNIQLQQSLLSSQMPAYSQAVLHSQQPYHPSAAPFPTFPSPIMSQYSVSTPQFPMHSLPGMGPSIPANMGDSHFPLLISETRTQNSEMRITLSKITDKVDSVISKIDDLRYQQGKSNISQAPYVDSAIILQNIERIVQENTQLKKEVEVKSSQLNSLNEKICDLLQRNQGFLEESNNMFEQRTDTLQAATVQSESKILNLEQEKTKLLSELSESLSKLKSSESEYQHLQKEKNELESKILQYEKEMREQESSLKEFRHQSNEVTAESEALVNSLRDEVRNVEQEKRLLGTKLMSLEEKCSELEETKVTLEKKYEESKLKIENIKTKLAEETMELNQKHQDEMDVLQRKLDQRTSSISEISGSIDKPDSQLELIKKQMTEILEEKDTLFSRTEEYKKKLIEQETIQNQYESKIQELETELQNTVELKQKYETYYEKTRWKLKERYETQIVELMSEVKRLQTSASVINSSPEFSGQIKKVMNTLYKLLQGKFVANTSYTGKEVLDLTLQTIMGLTIQLLENKSKTSSDVVQQTQEQNRVPDTTSTETRTETALSGTSESHSNKTVEETPKSVQENGLSDISHIADVGTVISSTSESETSQILETQAVESSIKQNSVDTSCNTTDAGAHVEQIVDNSTSINSENEKRDTEVQSESKSTVNEESERQDIHMVWKPQPPLFDDDEDEDDDDGWLK